MANLSSLEEEEEEEEEEKEDVESGEGMEVWDGELSGEGEGEEDGESEWMLTASTCHQDVQVKICGCVQILSKAFHLHAVSKENVKSGGDRVRASMEAHRHLGSTIEHGNHHPDHHHDLGLTLR